MNNLPDKVGVQSPKAAEAFTLVELLVATVIMVLVIILLATIVSQVSSISVRADAQISSFQRSRFAFERLTRSLSQASLNPYYDYMDSQGRPRPSDSNSTNFTPVKYSRTSDQHFCIMPANSFGNSNDVGWACFFQAPTGYSTNATNNKNTDLSSLDNLLNALGFFVEFNSDIDTATNRFVNPGALAGSKFNTNARWRYRLMELIQPTDQLGVYSTNAGGAWITNAMTTLPRPARPVADNVIAMILLAKDSAGGTNYLSSTPNSYAYDSRSKPSGINIPITYANLPPQVQVTMVAIDEPSAARLAKINGPGVMPDFGLSTSFQDPGQYTNDMKNLEAVLQTNASHITYRIFNTTVRIESAKWSTNN